MQRRQVIAILFFLWGIAVGWAFWSATGMAPAGDGLVRGLNKVTGFLGGVALSACFSIILLVTASRGEMSRRMVWAARVPAVLSLLAALGVAVLMAQGQPGSPFGPDRSVRPVAPQEN